MADPTLLDGDAYYHPWGLGVLQPTPLPDAASTPSGGGMWNLGVDPGITGAADGIADPTADFSANSPLLSSSGNPPAASAASQGTKANGDATTGMLIGAGLGLLSSIGQSNAHQAQGRAAAAQTRWSPWTHLGLGQMPANTNALGTIAGLTAAGGTMGQAVGGGSVSPMVNLFKPTVGYGTGVNG